MITIKKYRHRPVYKKFVNLRCNVQNKQKIFKFKRKKWNSLLFQLNRTTKTRKRNCYYKFLDQNLYNIPRFNNFFSKNHKQKVLSRKRFNLFYGSLGNRYLKKIVLNSNKNSNQIKNKINLNNYAISNLENRLDMVLVRSHFVISVRNARQLISHGHVLVNKVPVYDSSFLLIKGDFVTFSSKIHKIIKYYLTLSVFWPLPPEHLQTSYKLLSISVVGSNLLSRSNVQQSFWLDTNNVIQSYKR